MTKVLTQVDNFSGEETVVSWTVANYGEPVWAGTKTWTDAVYVSADPTFIAQRAILVGQVNHANVGGLATGGSYTSSAKIRLPAGIGGEYYIYVITDADTGHASSADEIIGSGNNTVARDTTYRVSAFEGLRNDNNMTRASLNVTYREPDLLVDALQVLSEGAFSGQPITVKWSVTNRGTRETRVSGWNDGLYLTRDASLDLSDYALRLQPINITEAGYPAYLKPGESYTRTVSVTLPESISGDFNLIVKADTDLGPYVGTGSTVRDGLTVLQRIDGAAGAVKEFQDEGNNTARIALPITLATPPDLQVASVDAPTSVLAGQNFTVNYRVTNAGGKTPSDQTTWNDLVYLSRDRFLDLTHDRYVGYRTHNGALAAGAEYEASLSITAPSGLEGPFYVFVVTDPANTMGDGTFGKVREFGKEQNNSGAALQPILLELPPPADLQVRDIIVPASANVGEAVRIEYTVDNQSDINPAYGRWADALYLSSDNAWDLGDIRLGKVEHDGGLAAGASYTASLTANLPPLKDGHWRVIVRPDIFNEVFEGPISYTATGLNMAPGEANNRTASASTLEVSVPTLTVGSPLATTLAEGQVRLYKVSVAGGETLRVSLDSSADSGDNEVFIRYGDIPSGYAYDAAYNNPSSADQTVLLPSTQAGDYYVLVRARQGAGSGATPVVLRADLMPLAITKVTPDQGGTGDDEHRWVTFDIEGASFKAGALVKLSRPGVYEAEPARWQVLDATHIRAVFDLRQLPHGLYDVIVINPDGQRVVEAQRYLVERGIEADVTIGIGGPRTLNPGESGVYSVSLQSLSNVDTPYVRFDFGAPEMGESEDVLSGIKLPYIVLGTNVGGSPLGQTVDAAGNTQAYGVTPTTGSLGTLRQDIPWASLDGQQNTTGFNLAPGYAFDLQAGGMAGMSFKVQTYPGLAAWMAHDFEGLRDALYLQHPDWKASGLLDGGVGDLDKIANGLTLKFLSKDPEIHMTKLENLAIPFRFNVVGAATPLTRDEFVAEQTDHARRLRTAILADTEAPSNLTTLAADEAQWVSGWLGALEVAGLLRPLDEAPPIRNHPEVLSLNATLATGILLAKGGEIY
ncbi:MAG TPA: CARDB domain-containing protein, partial [Rhodocyclaceae bacterium]|nr:CARDB domain-containing protein [Rhodocyclaceae bacterium]